MIATQKLRLPWGLTEGCTFRIEAGEQVAILGANGAGKTTLIRALAGVLRPTTGSVLLEGRDLATWSRGTGRR